MRATLATLALLLSSCGPDCDRWRLFVNCTPDANGVPVCLHDLPMCRVDDRCSYFEDRPEIQMCRSDPDGNL